MAWEWVITCKHVLGHDKKRLRKEEAPPKKVIGCTLMWWNDKDKNHDYTHEREPEKEQQSESSHHSGK